MACDCGHAYLIVFAHACGYYLFCRAPYLLSVLYYGRHSAQVVNCHDGLDLGFINFDSIALLLVIFAPLKKQA